MGTIFRKISGLQRIQWMCSKQSTRKTILLVLGSSKRSISPSSEHFASDSIALMVKNTDFDPDEYSLEAMGENKTGKSN
jgi:hypothetical protein